MYTRGQLIMGVDFVPILTRDFNASVEFYSATLELKRSAYHPDGGFAEFETGNLTLSVIDSEKMGLQHRYAPRVPEA